MRKRKSVVLDEIYTAYKKECKEKGKTPIVKDKFMKYCEYGNMELVNAVIFEAKEVMLPYNMGSVQVLRIERAFTRPRPDFGETRKLKSKGIDTVVYFTDEEYYKFNWNKSKCHLPYRSIWGFKPTSGNSVSVGGVKYILSQAVKNRPDLRVRYTYKKLKTK